jgi:hypothetical protein
MMTLKTQSEVAMRAWTVLILLVACGAARGEAKGGYTLFKPTPRAAMRDLNTDRPDTTESPYTVDAGHFQVEVSLVDYVHDRTGGVTTDQVTALPANLKVGLLNNVDLQFVINPYVNRRVGSSRSEGFDDMLVRLKVNLLGNDGGDVAFGVMPYVKLPTGTDGIGNDHFEGGIILPVAVALPAEFDVGAMLEVDFVRDAGNGYGTGLLHTVTVGRTFFKNVRVYVEYAGTSFAGAGETYQAVVGTGATYKIGENVQLDAGVNFGVSDSADDYNVFVGLSFRV